MSHFTWILATRSQEKGFLSAEQFSPWCSSRTRGQGDGAGDAVMLIGPHLPLATHPAIISATSAPRALPQRQRG